MTLTLKALKVPEDITLNPKVIKTKNNLNLYHLAYISRKNFLLLNFQTFSYIHLHNDHQNTKTIACAIEIDEENIKMSDKYKKEDFANKIFLSVEVFKFLKLDLRQDISITPLINIVGIRNYEINSQLNYFPQLIIAKKVFLTNIKNKNSSLVDKTLLMGLIKKPFLGYCGMEFSLSFSEILNTHEVCEFVSKLNPSSNPFLDSKKQKKLFKLFLSSNHGLIPNDIVHFRISMIQFQVGEEEKMVRTIGNEFFESYFIINTLRETEIILDNFMENSFLQFPAIDNKKMTQKNMLKIPCLRNLRNKLIKEMNFYEISHDQNYKCFLLYGKKGTGKKEILSLISKKFGLNYIEIDAKKIASLKSLEKNIKKYLNMRPVILNIRNFKSILHVVSNKVYQDPQKAFSSFIKDFLQDFKNLTKGFVDNFPCHLVMSCDKFDDLDQIDNEIKNFFDFFEKMPDFSLKELEVFWKICLESLPVHEISKNSSTFLADLATISKGIPWKCLLKIFEKDKNSGEKFLENINKSIISFKKNKEFDNPSIPNVKWEDVGGLVEAKNDIIDTIMLPQQYPQIFNEFMRPRTGLLFYGPPGTGKTLLAKCIATECKLNFISVKGPELLNMYIGESEKNVREIFDKARKNPPCIIFFDELDALAPKRGGGSDSSNVMDRIVAQFLTELDGINKDAVIYVIGATNRPDLLDESLLRPGRFDKKIYLGINEDESSRIKILEAQTRKLNLAKDVNFFELNGKIPINFTGADFYGLTSQSVLKALKRRIQEINVLYNESGKKEGFNAFSENLLKNNPNLAFIEVCQEDFVEALQTVKPSVSMEELKNYQALKEKFVV